MKINNLIGQTFSNLTVIKENGTSERGAMWLCQCACGNPKLVEASTSMLRQGNIKSCGCLKRRPERQIDKIIKQREVDGVRLTHFTDKPNKTSSTGFRGVTAYQLKSGELRYEARIIVKKKLYTKKGFLTPEEAYVQRKRFEENYLPKKHSQS